MPDIAGNLIAAFRVAHQFGAERLVDIAGEVVEAIAAHRQPKVLRRDVLELMGLVDDGVAAAGDHLAKVALPHRSIGAQQVMIDDDDVGFSCALTHLDDEAVAVTRAFRADAILRRRRDLVPER